MDKVAYSTMDLDIAFRAAENAVKNAKDILLVTHSRPDGDAIGATSAFLRYCRGLGLKTTAFCADPVPERFDFLPGTELFTSDYAVFDAHPDLIVSLDCGSLRQTRADRQIAAMRDRPRLVAFDHHSVNDHFGDIDVVDPTASSASEIVYRYLNAVRAPIDGDLATCLLTGIYFDTTAFSNSLTSRQAMEAASDLLRRGADVNLMVSRVFRSKTLDGLRLWGTALARLKHDERLGIASTAVFLKDFPAGEEQEGADGISNLLSGLLEVPVLMILKEQPGGSVRVSFRATGDRDVSALAQRLGGGGHRRAAACSVSGCIVETENGWVVK